MNYAGIQKVTPNDKPYEFTLYGTKIIPWLAKPYEFTYMNNTKLLNQDPVLTYDYLKLYNDGQLYKKFKSPLYEGFDDNTNCVHIYWILLMFIIIAILASLSL